MFYLFIKSGVKGFARSMPTSAAVDRVAKKKGKYLNNFIDIDKTWKSLPNANFEFPFKKSVF